MVEISWIAPRRMIRVWENGYGQEVAPPVQIKVLKTIFDALFPFDDAQVDWMYVVVR
jgi:hypothetical protein